MGLISTAELQSVQEGAGEDLMICDVRFVLTDHAQGRRAFEESRIAGAVYVDLHEDLADPTAPTGGRHPLPSPRAFAHTCERLGITPTTVVVAYDDVGGAMAARLWWMLRAVGHQHVQVLDGGWTTWVAEGRPVETGAPSGVRPSQAPGGYRVPDAWPQVVDAAVVAAGLGASDAPLLVDARAPERFRGEVEPLDARAGHIPGAINLFNGSLLGSDGRHRPLEELQTICAPILQAPEAVMYCGSGVAACHLLFAAHLLGRDDLRLYAGSWSDWSSDPDRPGATGDG